MRIDCCCRWHLGCRTEVFVAAATAVANINVWVYLFHRLCFRSSVHAAIVSFFLLLLLHHFLKVHWANFQLPSPLFLKELQLSS